MVYVQLSEKRRQKYLSELQNLDTQIASHLNNVGILQSSYDNFPVKIQQVQYLPTNPYFW